MGFLNLEQLQSRTGAKWGRYPNDVIACWVADMDLAVAPPIQAAVEQYVAKGDYGYVNLPEERKALGVLSSFLDRRHGWAPDPELGNVVGDVMVGVAGAIQMFTEPGDGVILQMPIYHPFIKAVKTAGRVIVENPLTETWGVDLEGLERAAASASMLLLAHPHNPAGRAFTHAELLGIAEIAIEHDLIVISDEIHGELVHAPFAHIPFQALGPDISERTISLVSATKPFNIAAIGAGVLLFGSAKLKERFDAMPSSLMGHLPAVGLAASQAAWTDGDAWLDATRELLRRNRDVVASWVDATDGVEMFTPEATYLAWLDFRGWGMDDPAKELLAAKVGLSSGLEFGEQGRGFARLNFATSPELLAEILRRISDR